MDGPAEGKPTWELIKQEGFDWIVEQMLMRDHRDATVVRIPNDSGGDGGIDIGVYYPDRTLIYQLKFYTDGFSTSSSSRKTQIKKSFKSVMKPKDEEQKKPDKWILVIPSKYTDTIHKWVVSKVLTTVDNPPEFEILDGPHLESRLLTDHPDILARFSRDDYFTSLVKLHDAEVAVLDGGVSDLTKRLEKLNKLAAELDDNWTLGFDTNSYGGITIYPIAKNPKAHELSPIGVRITIDSTALDDATRADFEGVVGFGVPGTVTVPEQAVHEIEWTGPEAIVPPSDWRSVVFGEAAPLDQFTRSRLILSVSGPDNGRPAVHDGEVTRVARGTNGISVQATFYRSATITLLLPMKEDRGGKLEVELDFVGHDPREVHRGIKFVESIRASSGVDAKLDDLNFTLRSDSADSDIDERLSEYADVAAEIDTLQDRVTTIFPMPPNVSVEDRAWMKALLIMLDGGIAPVPIWKLSGKSHAGTSVGESNPQSALMTCNEFELSLFDRDILVNESVYLCHPNANIVPASEPDEHGVTKFTIEGADDTVFLGYMPGRVRDIDKVIPWSIKGIADLPYPALPPRKSEPK